MCNDDFAHYIQYWKHNRYWLFDSPEAIQAVAQDNHIQLEGTSLFYYEVYEKEFDGKNWLPHQPDASFPTNVHTPSEKALKGFDVVTFFAHSSPECSPLSCNGLAGEIHTNEVCPLDSFENAYQKVSTGAFNQAEAGPYRMFTVYSVPRGNRPGWRDTAIIPTSPGQSCQGRIVFNRLFSSNQGSIRLSGRKIFRSLWTKQKVGEDGEQHTMEREFRQ